jgi:hypothetical protein
VTPTDGPDATPERAQPTSATHSSPPDGASPPGSVAEEAALLVDLLSRRTWADLSGMPSRGSRDDRADRATHDHGSAAGHTGDPSGAAGVGGVGGVGGSERASREEGRRDGRAGECTCGGSTPAACRVCPVCQLIAFVQQVNPDTIDRVADFIGFAATALRDLASAQRERRGEPGPDSPADPAADTAGDTAGDPAPDTASDTDRTRPGDSV